MAPAQLALGGTDMSRTETNAYAAIALAAVLGFTTFGAILDRVLQARRKDEKQKEEPSSAVRLWNLCLMLSSYALLIPGLTMTLLTWRLSFSFFGVTMPLSVRRESTLELVGTSAHQGALMAAIFITAYAMVIPALKLLLLLLGLAWQHGDGAKARWARRCLHLVQFVSKWASPDMFAYIVLMCLFRGLNKPPHLLSSFELGLGFSCFSIFCLGSTISCLGLRLTSPAAQAREAAPPAQERAEEPRGMGRLMLLAAVALAVAFAALLGVGITMPCMELHLDMALLYKNNPGLEKMRQVIDNLGLPKLLHEEISAWQCLWSLSGAILEGEVNGAIGLIMFGGFALLVPLADMLLLLLAACGLHSGRAGSSFLDGVMAVSRVLRKLSMLDVAIVGIAVVVLALRSFREKGVILSMQWGLLVLLGAVLCHFLMACLVARAHRRVPEQAPRPASVELAIQV